MTKLQIWKEKKGWSYERIGNEMGDGLGAVYYWELFQGKFKCDVRTAARLNRLTNVSTYCIQHGI